MKSLETPLYKWHDNIKICFE